MTRSLHEQWSPEWTLEAACQGRDVDDFFVDDLKELRDGVNLADLDELFTWPVIRAKDVCADCPVRRDCLEWTFQVEDDLTSERRYGVAGGTIGRERELVASDPRRVEILEWAFELQRRRWNLGSLRRWPRRGLAAVG